MTRDEAKAVLLGICSKWPDWKPTEEEAEAWISDVLMPMRDVELVDRAIRNAFANKRFSKPTPKEIKDEYSRIATNARPAGENPSPQIPLCGWWIVCARGKRAGWVVPIITGPDTNTDDGRLAESMRARHEAMYGGRWLTLREYTPDQAMETGRRCAVEASYEPADAI